MYKLTSTCPVFNVKGRGKVFVVESPVSAARNGGAMLEALGKEIEINGIVYEPIGVEMYMPNSPVSIGEHIGLCVKPHLMDSQDPTKVLEVGSTPTWGTKL